jgi:hypothetical protein
MTSKHVTAGLQGHGSNLVFHTKRVQTGKRQQNNQATGRTENTVPQCLRLAPQQSENKKGIFYRLCPIYIPNSSLLINGRSVKQIQVTSSNGNGNKCLKTLQLASPRLQN